VCGIYGEIAFKDSPDTGGLSRAMKELRSRGPDAEGIYQQAHFAVGHRRLSILDLSSASQQPMLDNDLGLGVVFNGCIYNYRELREELKQKGYRFFSQGDTEVILKAYHAWGIRSVQRLKGMFAFALWERDSGKFVLVRDRLGVKPLYYSESRDRLRFASTLPAILAAGDVDKEIDDIALHQYFSFHAAVPAPRTIIKGVRKLPPATILTVEPDGTRTTEVYWNVDIGQQRLEDRRKSTADWIDDVAGALRTAISRRVVSDVPVGVLLSGGLDSSLLVAILAHLKQNDINTFSIGFESVDSHQGTNSSIPI
jgi:asparagine synthase (glutamine-hydrolysing)